MIRKDTTLLGIDLHEHEIRVVQVKNRANKSSIGKIGRAQMPIGAMVRGKVMQPSSVAVALRLLLNSMDIGTTGRAVVGVLGDTTALRTLPIPPVPDADLPMIVAGEVEHYGIVRTEGGTHAFLRLYPPPRNLDNEGAKGAGAGQDKGGDDNDKPVHVTIVALEEDVISTLRQAIEEANLTIDSIEPTQYGMYRAVMLASNNANSAFGLMVNPANTDIAIAYKGNLVAYRRVDVGSRSILLNAPAPVEAGFVDPSREVFVDDYHEAYSEESYLNFSAIETLSVEIQRTLDYYQREFPNVSIGDRLYLTIDDARLEPLANELSQRLGILIEAVQPVESPNDSPEAIEAMASGLGPTYAAAYGLAVQGPISLRVPRLDLFTKERTAVQKAETKRNFKGSIITSGVAILLAVVGYVTYGRQISQLEAYTKEREAKATEIVASTNITAEKHHRQSEQFKALRHEGVPVSAMMDYIASTIERGTGLTQLNVLPDLTVTIDGESVNNAGMISTLQTLQGCPVFQELQMISFRQLPADAGYGVAFELRGKAVSMDRIEMPGVATK